MPNGGRLTIETASVTVTGEQARDRAGLSPGDYVMLVVADCRWSAKMGHIRGLENPRDGGWCELLDTG